MAGKWLWMRRLGIKFTSIQINKKNVQRWTQGGLYNFKEGDLIWDAPEPFLSYSDKTGKLTEWRDVVPYIKFGLQVEMATPVMNGEVIVNLEIENRENVQSHDLETVDIKITRGSQGSVRFHHLYPDKNTKNILKDLEPYNCTQEEFIILLKTGLLYQKSGIDPVDFFELTEKKNIQTPKQQKLF